jgi:hypothetical protein
LHPDTFELDGLFGEAVAICTTADERTCETWIEGFEADGVVRGLVDAYREVPEVPQGAAIRSVVWD